MMRKICETCCNEREMFSWENKCYQCANKEWRDGIKSEILNGDRTDVDSESDIICPWCGEVYEIDDEYDLYEEGDHEVQCGYCEKDFEVCTWVRHTYDTKRKEDGHES